MMEYNPLLLTSIISGLSIGLAYLIMYIRGRYLTKDTRQ